MTDCIQRHTAAVRSAETCAAMYAPEFGVRRVLRMSVHSLSGVLLARASMELRGLACMACLIAVHHVPTLLPACNISHACHECHTSNSNSLAILRFACHNGSGNLKRYPCLCCSGDHAPAQCVTRCAADDKCLQPIVRPPVILRTILGICSYYGW